MQNQDQDKHNLVTDQLGQNDRAPSPEDSRAQDAAARNPRRRTQEQGQGDLDDDWQDTNPAVEAQASTASPSQSGPQQS